MFLKNNNWAILSLQGVLNKPHPLEGLKINKAPSPWAY